MSTIFRFNPNSEFEAFDRLFDRMVAGQRSRGDVLPLDVFEKENSLFIRTAMPGVNPSDLSIQIDENVLTIEGETARDSAIEEAKVYMREVSTGKFRRSIRLPEGLDLDAVDAEFDHGMVTIKLPRVVEEKPEPRRIEVRSKSDALEAKAGD